MSGTIDLVPRSQGGPLITPDFLDSVVNAALLAPATGANTQRSHPDRFAEVVNVKDFGAVGNGVTDDTVAINAAMNFVRLRPLVNNRTACRVVFPYGHYLVTAPLNFTGLSSSSSSGILIEGCGSEIIFKMSGGAGIDALGSRWLRFRNLALWGDATTTPAIGIQIGRTVAATPAGTHRFDNVTIDGSWSRTCFYNNAGEVVYYSGCFFRNILTGADKFCAIMDGMNHWAITSTFVTVTATVDGLESFNENLFVSCTFQGNGNTGVVWMANVSHFKMVRCYASSIAGSIFTIWTGAGTSVGGASLDLDCHCETTGLQYVFLFTGPLGVTFTQFRTFSFEDHACWAGTAVFAIDPASAITQVAIWDARLVIFLQNPAAPTLYSSAAAFKVSASACRMSESLWTMPGYWAGPVGGLTSATNGGTLTVPDWLRVVATNGGTTAPARYTQWVSLVPAGAIAGHTVTMPPLAIHAQEVTVTTTQTITTLTIGPNSGQTVAAQPAGGDLSANTAVTYRYDGTTDIWLLTGKTS